MNAATPAQPDRYTAEQNRILNNGKLVMLVTPIKVTDDSIALAEKTAKLAVMQLMAIALGNEP